MNNHRFKIIVIAHQTKKELSNNYAYNLRISSNLMYPRLKNEFDIVYKGIWEIKLEDVITGHIFIFYKSLFFYKSVSILINILKEAGKIILFDTDDYYLDIPSYSSSINLLTKQSRNRYIDNIKKASHIIVSTEYLKRMLLVFNPSITVIENTLDIKNSNIKSDNNNPVINILLTSNDNLKLISFKDDFIHCLRDIKLKYGNKINLILLGRFFNIRADNNIFDEVHEKISPDDYFKFLSSRNIDIGLVPLSSSEDPETYTVHCCKSNIKFLEFAHFGIAGIYSDIEPYRCITNLKDGILVRNTKQEWEKAIDLLIRDPGFRRKIGESSRYKLKKLYSKEISQKKFYLIITNIVSTQKNKINLKKKNNNFPINDISLKRIYLYYYVNKYSNKLRFIRHLVLKGELYEVYRRVLKILSKKNKVTIDGMSTGV